MLKVLCVLSVLYSNPSKDFRKDFHSKLLFKGISRQKRNCFRVLSLQVPKKTIALLHSRLQKETALNVHGRANFKKSMMSIHYAAYTIALLNLCSSFSEGIAFWVFSARLAASMAAASRFRFTYGCFCSWCLSSSSNSSGGTSHEHIHLQIRPLGRSHSMPRDSLHVSQSWCKWLAKSNYYWVNNMIPSNAEGLIAGQAKMFASTGQPCLVL